MCFLNSETGFLHISQIRFVGFGSCFDPFVFFSNDFYWWKFKCKCCWVHFWDCEFSYDETRCHGCWKILNTQCISMISLQNEFRDGIILCFCCITCNTRCIWPFLPSAGESFAYDISTSPSYLKPLNICHMAFCQDHDSLVAIIKIIEGHLAEITLFRLCEWFDAVPAVCRLQHCENKCHIWVDYHEHKHGNWSGSEIWKSFCKGSMSLLVLCERG